MAHVKLKSSKSFYHYQCKLRHVPFHHGYKWMPHMNHLPFVYTGYSGYIHIVYLVCNNFACKVSLNIDVTYVKQTEISQI